MLLATNRGLSPLFGGEAGCGYCEEHLRPAAGASPADILHNDKERLAPCRRRSLRRAIGSPLTVCRPIYRIARALNSLTVSKPKSPMQSLHLISPVFDG